MSISGNVSLLAQSNSQVRRLNDLRTLLDTLQRQSTTQKKAENYAGLGTDALNVQRLRDVQALTQTYIKNADTVAARLDVMSNAMTQISKMAAELRDSSKLDGSFNMDSVNDLAKQTMSFIRDLVNEQWDGRYIFAGADAQSKPFDNIDTVFNNAANQVGNWLNGTVTTDAMLATADGFSSLQLGLNGNLAASGNLTARISDSVDVDYTVKADQAGFTDIIRACAMLSQLKQPDMANGDVPTTADFETAIQHIVNTLNKGVQSVNTETLKLSSKYALIGAVKDTLTTDNGILLKQIDAIENVDASAAIINLQLVQNQLQAAYQVTSVVSNLSLVNFM